MVCKVELDSILHHPFYTHHSGEIHSDEEEMEEGGGKGEREEEGELVPVK